MTTPLSKTPPAPNPTRQRRVYSLWSVVFIILGVGLLIVNFSFSTSLSNLSPAWPALLVVVGLVMLRADRAARNFVPPSYALSRGDYETAQMQVFTLTSDVRVGAFVGATQLAVGQYPNPAGPRVNPTGRAVRLLLDHRAVLPFMAGDWTADLVKGLSWSFDLHSLLGHFTLNLRDLTLATGSLHSLAGNVDVTLPTVGQGEMDLHLTLGDLTVRVPEGLAVKIRVKPGPLATVRLDDPTFIKTDKTEWVTPYFSAAAQRYTLTITLGAGDLIITRL